MPVRGLQVISTCLTHTTAADVQNMFQRVADRHTIPWHTIGLRMLGSQRGDFSKAVLSFSLKSDWIAPHRKECCTEYILEAI